MASDIAQTSLIQTRNELHQQLVNLCETLITHDGNVSRTKAAFDKASIDRLAALARYEELKEDAAEVEAAYQKLTGRKMPKNNVTKEPSP